MNAKLRKEGHRTHNFNICHWRCRLTEFLLLGCEGSEQHEFVGNLHQPVARDCCYMAVDQGPQTYPALFTAAALRRVPRLESGRGKAAAAALGDGAAEPDRALLQAAGVATGVDNDGS